MESVFSEIFSFRVSGGEVFMQRRFELSSDTPAEALAYIAERWPVPFSLWRQKLDAGENVLQQSHRRAAAFAEGFPGLAAFNEALASQIGA